MSERSEKVAESTAAPERTQGVGKVAVSRR
jgi:hypothetical protein